VRASGSDFFGITLPLIRPGLFCRGAPLCSSGASPNWARPLAVCDYSRVTPVQIFNGLKGVESSAEPYALTFIMLCMSVLAYTLGKIIFGGKAYEMYAKASRAGGRGPPEQAVQALLAMGAFAIVLGAGAAAAHRRGGSRPWARGRDRGTRACCRGRSTLSHFPAGPGERLGEFIDQQLTPAGVVAPLPLTWGSGSSSDT